jgi:transposase
LELKRQGWLQIDIAEALGVCPASVSQWLKTARQEGEDALISNPAPGRQPFLPKDQLAELPKLLAKGAEYYGFLGNLWTTRRVAKLIKDTYGVSYHPAHISRLLRSIGWSVQKPIRRATQRDEQAVEEWYTERWPEIKRGPRKKVERSCG